MERRVEKRGHRLCPASRESPCVVISSPGKMRCQRARPWRVGGEQKANGQCTSQRRRAEQRLAGDPAACAAVRRCRCAREKSFPADPFESHYDRLSGGLSSSSSSPPPFSALRCSCPLSNSLRARERPSLACSPSLTIFSPSLRLPYLCCVPPPPIHSEHNDYIPIAAAAADLPSFLFGLARAAARVLPLLPPRGGAKGEEKKSER